MGKQTKNESKNQITVAQIRMRMRTLSFWQIDATLKEVEHLLNNPELNLLEIWILEGRRRELFAAKWLMNHLLWLPSDRQSAERLTQPLINDLTAPTPWALIYQTTLKNIDLGLENLTSTPLEIDILKPAKKQELLRLILEQFQLLINELAEAEINSNQLLEKIPTVLSDLWQAAISRFLGKYYQINYEGQAIELVNVLLQDQDLVRSAILAKIPLVFELCQYLLFQTPLIINNTAYDFETPAAIARSQVILDNLLVQVANAVMQPLLNHFADVEEIKQKFYDYHRMATREVERFRNDLSWRYRVEIYWGEPQAIYESQFQLFTLANSGINKIRIYAPRNRELAKLTGVRFLVTLLLELEDAIAPRLQTIMSFIGSGIVYLLKNVIGKGLGLIGNGILQGIGASFGDGGFKTHKKRSL